MKKLSHSLLILLTIFLVNCSSDENQNNNADCETKIQLNENTNQDSKSNLAPSLIEQYQDSDDSNFGGEINLLWSDPPTLDPHLTTDGTSIGIVVELFSGLVKLNSNESPPVVADLAESWNISEDGTIYDFTLRPNLKFSDGELLTAEDVKWSFERAANPKTGSPVAEEFLGDIIGIKEIINGQKLTTEGISVINDRTIRIKIDAPKAYFLAKLSYPTAFILSKKNVEDKNNNWLESPIGTGPFILKDYTVGKEIILNRNDNFWDRKAYLDKIVFNLAGGVPMAMYENNEIDITGVTLADLERVEDKCSDLNNDLVTIPPRDAITYIAFNTNKAPFDDIKFRQALNHAIDKQLIADQVFSNLVIPADGIIPPNFPGYSEKISSLGFNLEKAQSLLAESKYASYNIDSSGPEIDISKIPRITLTIPGTGGSVGFTTEIIADMWRENLGIDINIQQVEWATYIQDLHKGRLQAWSGLAWEADYPDPQTFIDVLFRSDSSINYGSYNNKNVDDFIYQAQVEQDTKIRYELYNQAEQIIINEAPWLPLWWGTESISLVKPRIKNLKFYSLSVSRFKDVWIKDN
ncbi:MAG: hypothetical protein CL714_02780 [Chloroflexi bacterium]|mgnify:FL=1|nr:hypothetical protein [Chloroflexota bacterium]|tara:strand:+ start:1306 stop:3042 length:1737 start_codon:yes stop_codon:yes gene_type:complete